jgi:hypothetical protein
MCVFLKYSPFSRKLGTRKKLWSNLGLGLFAYQLGFCKTCVESPNKLSRKKQDQVGHIYFIFLCMERVLQRILFENINAYKIRTVPGWLMPLHCYTKTSAKDGRWMGLRTIFVIPCLVWNENS